MNKQEVEAQKMKLASEIMELCLEINGIGEGRVLIDGSPCIFLNLTGHVGWIEIKVFESGWDSSIDEDYSIKLDKYKSLMDFKDCLSYLNSLEENASEKRKIAKARLTAKKKLDSKIAKAQEEFENDVKMEVENEAV